MSSPFNISEASAIAFHALVALSAPDTQLSAKEISAHLEASLNHTVRVMHRLRQMGFVESVRGAGGGFKLAVDPSQTTLLQVYEAMEGPLSCKHCILLGESRCPSDRCLFAPLTHKVDKLIAEFFTQTTLASFNKKGKHHG